MVFLENPTPVDPIDNNETTADSIKNTLATPEESQIKEEKRKADKEQREYEELNENINNTFDFLLKEEGIKDILDTNFIYNLKKGIDSSGLIEELGIDLGKGDLENKLKALMISAKLVYYELGEDKEKILKSTYEKILPKINSQSNFSIDEFIENKKEEDIKIAQERYNNNPDNFIIINNNKKSIIEQVDPDWNTEIETSEKSIIEQVDPDWNTEIETSEKSIIEQVDPDWNTK